jgi:hypothetical protein
MRILTGRSRGRAKYGLNCAIAALLRIVMSADIVIRKTATLRQPVAQSKHFFSSTDKLIA